MITDADIKKLSKVFGTKKDFSRLEKKMDNRFNTVDNRFDRVDKQLNTLEKRVDELTDFLVPAIGNILEWTDDIHRAIVEKPSKHSRDN